MATITDQQAISFSNTKARKFADALLTAITTATDLLAAWNNGVNALIPNTSDILVDGASVNGTNGVGGDGRRVLTGININDLINRAIEMDRYRDHGTIAAGSSDPAAYNTIQKPSVNGGPLF